LPVFAVLFITDAAICLERNAVRHHPRPEATIRRQAARCLEVGPEISAEGYEVFVVRDQASRDVRGPSDDDGQKSEPGD
jgi:hypothetical protein